ncbi:MAG: methyltransferase domain-containing protein [Sedimentisphaerales bacterium]|nr:methyltransferase domain-containing protein [Sedimentisphaerales bacterium]
MQDQPSKSPRQVALEVLDGFNIALHDAAELLGKKIEQTHRKGRATDIVYGVIRNRTAIDLVIEKIAGKPVKRIIGKLVNVVRIGVYELVYSTETAEFAAVNEAVELANAMVKTKQAGFVNALLRNITRSIVNRTADLSEADVLKTLPNSRETGCSFDKDLLADPESEPAGYLSESFSLPLWLVEEWIKEFGFEKAKDICFASNRRPGVYLWANVLKTSTEELLKMFNSEDVEAVEAALPGGESMVKIKTHQSVSRLAGFKEGMFFVQDPAAWAVVKELCPEPGWTVIDLCAGPGTKTIQLAMAMNDEGEIIASDIDEERLEKVQQNADRAGFKSIKTVLENDLPKVISGLKKIDAILVDVPCSNTGVLAKRAEVRHRINKSAVESLVKTQKELLNYAAGIISPGGKICYSTCSILKDENEDVINSFLAVNSKFRLLSQKLILPGCAGELPYDHDGSFAALLTL